MKKNIVIGLLGNRNSGKSSTWYELFDDQVRTGSKIRRLYLTKTEYIEVFLVSGSPEERDLYVGNIIGDLKPRIVLCSMQYIPEVIETVEYFINNDYLLYLQWLNPGFGDSNDIAHFDYFGIVSRILTLDSIISIRNGKITPTDRVREIKDYLYGWASSRKLILKDPS